MNVFKQIIFIVTSKVRKKCKYVRFLGARVNSIDCGIYMGLWSQYNMDGHQFIFVV